MLDAGACLVQSSIHACSYIILHKKSCFALDIDPVQCHMHAYVILLKKSHFALDIDFRENCVQESYYVSTNALTAFHSILQLQ